MAICPEPSCPAITPGGPCDQHRKERSRLKEQHRGSARQRGYSSRWDAYSKARLAKHPWCVGFPHGYHGTERVLATVTNHIVPVSRSPERFWDEANHESLCTSCNVRHSIATGG